MVQNPTHSGLLTGLTTECPYAVTSSTVLPLPLRQTFSIKCKSISFPARLSISSPTFTPLRSQSQKCQAHNPTPSNGFSVAAAGETPTTEEFLQVIPGNTGCVARTCAASSVELHLVEEFAYRRGTVRIPMVETYVRCLNLSASVGIAVYEASRLLNYEQLQNSAEPCTNGTKQFLIEDIFA